MHVIGHQHAGMDGATELGGEFLKVMQVERVILLGIETDRAMVAALDDVPRNAGDGEAVSSLLANLASRCKLHALCKLHSGVNHAMQHA